MRPYFEKMAGFGKPLKENRIARAQESRAKLEAVEAEIAAARKAKENVGIPAAEINKRGSLTVWQRWRSGRAGHWHPLHSLYNPADNAEGTTNVVDGLGRIGGRWAVVIGFDNKWLPARGSGPVENMLRVTDLAPAPYSAVRW
jgi:glutaconyl-CoA decarboxylase